jgi:hypothetical protein
MHIETNLHPSTGSKGTRNPFRRIPLLCRIVGCLLLAIPCAVLSGILLVLGPLPPPAQPTLAAAVFSPGFHKGITYESWWNGEYASPNSDQTLAEVIQPTGADWIALIVKCHQETETSTTITCDTGRMSATDAELVHVIERAHSLGLKVMLKPHLDLSIPDPASGRHHIGFSGDETAWRAWFKSYTDFITHYAALGQSTGAEYFVIGTELSATTHRESDWRAVVDAVRAVYSGKLTYAALTYLEPLRMAWWDALDAIGIDAYFLLSVTTTPTLEQLKLGWTPALILMERLAEQWNKPVILTEVGYMSVDGTNRVPGYWALEGAIDGDEQALAYQSVFEAFSGKPWWGGVYFWSYSTNPNQGGADDRGYSPHGKPAEDVLRRYFAGDK